MQRSTRGRDAIRRPVARPVHPRDRTVSLSDREVKLMAHAPSAQSGASGQRPEARELLFKPDCPRAIDHHIDYFGTSTTSAEPASPRPRPTTTAAARHFWSG